MAPKTILKNFDSLPALNTNYFSHAFYLKNNQRIMDKTLISITRRIRRLATSPLYHHNLREKLLFRAAIHLTNYLDNNFHF